MTTYAPEAAAHAKPVAFPALGMQAKRVKITFDVFAWFVLIAATILTGLFIVNAIDASMGDSRSEIREDYYGQGYSQEISTPGDMELVKENLYIAGGIAFYGAFTWAGVKLAGLAAGHIANKN